MSTKKTIAKNAISNWIGYTVNILIAFFLSPFIVHSLGDTQYGIWSLIVSLTGYYGLLDLGIRSAVGQYITRYHAQNKTAELNKTFSTAFFVLSVIGFLIFIATVVLAIYFPRLFNVGDTSVIDIQISLLIIGINIAVGFPFSLYSTVLTSLQRFELSNVVGISTKILNLMLMIIVLKRGWGLLGMSVVTSLTNLSSWILSVILAQRILPSIKLSLKYFSKFSFKEMRNYSIFIFIMNISDLIINYTSSIIIGLFMPVAAITYYSIAWILPTYLRSLNTSFTFTLAPVSITFDAGNDKQKLKNLLIQGSKISSLFIIPISIVLLFWGSDFLSLWMGSEYVSGKVFASSGKILSLLMIALLPSCLGSTGWQILFGIRKVKFPAILSIVDTLVILSLSIILVKKMGLIGVALANIIPSFIISVGIIPKYVCKQIGLSLKEFVFEAFFHSGIAGFIFVIIFFGLDILISELNWFNFSFKVVISTLIYALISLRFCIPYEIRAILVKKIKLLFA